MLGFDRVEDYVRAGGSFGALLGRTANRIAGGRFQIDGKTFVLSKNEGENTLHGGAEGFGLRLWKLGRASADMVSLELTSPDGDQGFPGALAVRATYRLSGDTLTLEFEASATAPTPVSLSAHPYFNLAGKQEILDHEVTIYSDCFLPTDARQIPVGETRQVAETPFDFREPQLVRARIREVDPQLLYGKGYDHYFVLRGAAGTLRPAARLSDPASGRVLEICTTQPGLQFYTGNNLNGTVAGRDGIYRQSAGLAFEPQGFPNAVNEPRFPTTVVRPGSCYRHIIAYRFPPA